MKKHVKKITSPLPPGLRAEKLRGHWVAGLWRAWLWATAALAVAAGVCVGFGGPALVRSWMQSGPFSHGTQTLMCVGILWLALGVCGGMMQTTSARWRWAFEHSLALILLVLAANFIRERPYHGDAHDYFLAAQNLASGVAFHPRYLYPPLLATLLQALLPFGESFALNAMSVGTMLAFVLFYYLLVRFLQMYSFGPRMAQFLAFAALLLNVPAIRTLGYAQINFAVMDLVLGCFLLRNRHAILSALCLAAAAHLKVTPAIFALPFLLVRDWKWLASFAAAGVAIAAITVVPYGVAPFVSFLNNADGYLVANGICFRECSPGFLARSFGVPWLAIPLQASIFIALLLGAIVSTGGKWKRRRDAEGKTLNSLPMLFGAMIFASPIIWPHHFVFLVPSAILVMKKLATARAWRVYFYAWFAVYALPVFDVWPLSFVRMFGALAILWLCWKFRDADTATWFNRCQDRLNRFFDFRPRVEIP